MVAVPRTAQSLALVGLLSVSACIARSESIPPQASPRDQKLVIFLTSDAALKPAISTELKQEVDHLMQTAAIQVEWRDPKIDRGGVENDYSALVRMRGSCRPAEPSTQFEHAVTGTFPLASSAVSDGVILPYGDIDCAALNSYLGPALWKESDRIRDFEYARAVARLMAHELYHMVAQTSVHTHTGVTKPAVTVAELLSDHFDFTEGALTEFHASPEAVVYSLGSDSVETSGK